MLDRLKAKVHSMTAPERSERRRTPPRNESGASVAPGAIPRLSAEELEKGTHRAGVGGMWDEIGALQFEFLRENGLSPEHRLLDMGCGSLRGGVHFVRYLERGNYYGMDIQEALLEAGRWELEQAGLSDRKPNLLAAADFKASRFEATFDYAISVSLFTHLYLNQIVRCLKEVGKVLEPDGKYYATFFEAPEGAHLEPVAREPGGWVTTYDADPFHYSLSEMRWCAETAGLACEYVGDWNHPREQRMLVFSL